MQLNTSSPDAPQEQSQNPEPEKRFRGWRLIGFILIVVTVLALVSAVVDWLVLGPLEGRAF